MTMEACYQKLGGDYADVCTRLPSLRLVEKFAGKFLEDKTFVKLCDAVEAGNWEEAFRAAHTLKGVCANLSFSQLMRSASQLTEMLRPGTVSSRQEVDALLEEVWRDYLLTVDTIREYMAEK